MSKPARTLALCTDLGATAGAAPAAVELIPAGPRVVGRDGRAWSFDASAAAAVVAAFQARNAALPIDWEHASQHRAPNGQDAPAAGWIESLDVRDGALWGAVAWTERGANQVGAREYRYLSPVFDFEPSGRIVRLVSAGLTNLPNLHLQALNHEESPMNRSAALTAAIVGALGLAATVDDDALATAINQIKTDRDAATARALNAEKAQPQLDRYVPRADYDAQVTRATNAESALKTRVEGEHKTTVDAVIADALKAGKITPATEGYHRASCTDAAGLDRLRAFVGAAPVIGADSGLSGKKPTATDTALNAEELAVCAATGVSPEDFAKSKAA